MAQSGVFCQHEQTDPISIYFKKIGPQSGLYNGLLYPQYRQRISGGHPYFLKDSLVMGEVFYDDAHYRQAALMLDEISDELITTDPKRQYLIQLIKSKVASFSIGSHNFVNLNINSSGSNYYEVLYTSTSDLLKKERKSLKRSNKGQDENELAVRSTIRYYIRLDNNYHEVKTKRSFLKLLEKKGKSVTEFLRSQHLSFRKEKQRYLITALTFYDGL